MREFEVSLTEEIKKGLIPFSNRSRNLEGLSVCHNIEPFDEGMRTHEAVISLNANQDWGAEEALAAVVTTRTITIAIKDWVSEDDVVGAMVYIDGVLAGTADENGELTIVDIELGGHSIKITAAGYLDSDTDYLLNDYFVVT
jgi:hypothetical protein